MEGAARVAEIAQVQRALGVLAALQLTAHLYTQQCTLTDGGSFDFIVVGGGSAGSVLANRLTEHPQASVLLIEAGGDPPIESMFPGLFALMPRSHVDHNYTSENDYRTNQCHRNRVTNLTSGFMLGGSSSINYMFYVRGNPYDYHVWASAAEDWTWSWEGVLPYFIKSEKLKDPTILYSPYSVYHGTDGYLGVTREYRKETEKFLEAAGELGHKVLLDINGDCQLGFTNQLYTIADGVRQSTAYSFLSPVRHRKNLFILKNTKVVEVIFDEHNNAVGVKAKTLSGHNVTFSATREVILSAGSLRSPQLLMLSGIGPKEHLEEMAIPVRSNLPVGMNYQDHVIVTISIKLDASNASPKPPVQDFFPLPAFTGYVALDKHQQYPDYQVVQLVVPNDSDVPLSLCAFNFWLDFDICQNLHDAGKGRNTLLVMLNILHPQSRGRVLLRSKSIDDPPKTYTGMFKDERDLDNLVRYIQDYIRIVNTTHFKSIGAEIADLKLPMCAELRAWSAEYWRCYARCLMNTMYHYSGTCAMGRVLDSRLRVRGVRRLRVVDASVMPTLPGGNTNAPVIMIAEKAADFIKQDHHLGF